jgi:hypothetical protein
MIGIPLIVLWLYIDERSKKEQQQNKNFVSSKISSHKQQQQHQHCTCPICEHRQAEVCMHEKCACCIIMKDGSVIGHSINPLQ